MRRKPSSFYQRSVSNASRKWTLHRAYRRSRRDGCGPVEPLARLPRLIQAYSSMLLVLLMQRMELIDPLELRSASGGVGLRALTRTPLSR